LKKNLLLTIILSLILIVNFESARATSLKDNPRLAILPYTDKAAKSIGLGMKDASIVSEFLMEQFLDSMRFKIVEREKMKEILAEHSLNASGLVDPLTAVSVGKLAGAQFLVAGSVTGLSSKKSGASYSHSEKGSIDFNSYTVIANITLRIIDIEDGSVVMAVSGTGESARTSLDFVLRQEIRNYYDDYGYDDYSNVNSGEILDSTGESNISTTSDEGNENYPADNENNLDIGNVNGEENVNNPENEENEIYSDETDSGEIYTGNEEEFSGVENSSDEEYYNEGMGGGYSTKIVEHRLTIGGRGYSMVQVRNALYKAAVDAVYNKDYGVLAKLDGKAKRRKV